MATRKPARKKRITKKKPSRKKKVARTGKAAKKKQVKRTRTSRKSSRRGREQTTFAVGRRNSRGLDSGSGGQSGDTQGLSRREDEDSESVEELAEEGQYFEAEAVSGVENAKDPDQGEVTTSEVPEDDVPSEYDEQD